MPAFKTVRGMRDFLPRDAERMRHVEQVTRELAHLYGYEEVITPVVESYDLLAVKAGFNDVHDLSLSIRCRPTKLFIFSN